jgi:hypothetical protein
MFMSRMKDGKVVESWNNVDFYTLFRQIGAIDPELVKSMLAL